MEFKDYSFPSHIVSTSFPKWSKSKIIPLDLLKQYPSADGLHIDSLFELEKHGALTYNDFLILPGSISKNLITALPLFLLLALEIAFLASDANLDIEITRRFALKAPLLSSPMDTVTEHNMAIHMPLLGGLGVVHKSCSPEDQAEMVRKVKRHENGFIFNPAVLSPTATVEDAKKLKFKWGFGGFPVMVS